VHILNGGPWAEALIAMMKLVLKSKIIERVSLAAYSLSFTTLIPEKIFHYILLFFVCNLVVS
jgi:hypothetical protein